MEGDAPMTRRTEFTERYRFATRDDLPAFLETLEDPAVTRWLWFAPAPPSFYEAYFGPLLDAQAEALARGRLPATSVFAVEDGDGGFLGQGATVAVEGSPGGFEIGFQLRRAAWGRGVGTRLAWFLGAYAVRCHGAHRLEGSCLVGNMGSRRLMTILGLQEEGRRPGFRLKEGQRHTELLYGAEVAALDGVRLAEVAEVLGLGPKDAARPDACWPASRAR